MPRACARRRPRRPRAPRATARGCWPPSWRRRAGVTGSCPSAWLPMPRGSRPSWAPRRPAPLGRLRLGRRRRTRGGGDGRNAHGRDLRPAHCAPGRDPGRRRCPRADRDRRGQRPDPAHPGRRSAWHWRTCAWASRGWRRPRRASGPPASWAGRRSGSPGSRWPAPCPSTIRTSTVPRTDALARIAELGLTLPAIGAARITDPATGQDLPAEDTLRAVVVSVLARPHDWAGAVTQSVPAGTVAIMVSPLGALAGQTAADLRGRAALVIDPATPAGRMALFTPGGAPAIPETYERFAPRAVRAADGTLRLANLHTRMSGRSPMILPGMTPSTAEAPIVVAAANGGHVAELAGGGQVTERIFTERIAEVDRGPRARPGDRDQRPAPGPLPVEPAGRAGSGWCSGHGRRAPRSTASPSPPGSPTRPRRWPSSTSWRRRASGSTRSSPARSPRSRRCWRSPRTPRTPSGSTWRVERPGATTRGRTSTSCCCRPTTSSASTRTSSWPSAGGSPTPSGPVPCSPGPGHTCTERRPCRSTPSCWARSPWQPASRRRPRR